MVMLTKRGTGHNACCWSHKAKPFEQCARVGAYMARMNQASPARADSASGCRARRHMRPLPPIKAQRDAHAPRCPPSSPAWGTSMCACSISPNIAPGSPPPRQPRPGPLCRASRPLRAAGPCRCLGERRPGRMLRLGLRPRPGCRKVSGEHQGEEAGVSRESWRLSVTLLLGMLRTQPVKLYSLARF